MPQIFIGLVGFGAGLAVTVRGRYGEGPWTVFHEGVSLHTPLTIGNVSILTGAALVTSLMWAREPLGLGTLINIVVIGVTIDLTLLAVDTPDAMAWRMMLTLAGPLMVALGTGLYLGVRLGPGPRDGVMTAMNRRGVPLWLARFIIEAIPLLIGALLGGKVGWGTLYWLVVIGPAVHVCVPLFAKPEISTRWTDVFNATSQGRPRDLERG